MRYAHSCMKQTHKHNRATFYFPKASVLNRTFFQTLDMFATMKRKQKNGSSPTQTKKKRLVAENPADGEMSPAKTSSSKNRSPKTVIRVISTKLSRQARSTQIYFLF